MMLQSRAAFLEGLLAAGPAMVNALPPPACIPADPFEYSRLRFFDTCAKANKHVRPSAPAGFRVSLDFALRACAAVHASAHWSARRCEPQYK